MNPETKIVTRNDVAALLSSIGPKGEKRDEKIEAVKALAMTNLQGIDLVQTLDSYEQF